MSSILLWISIPLRLYQYLTSGLLRRIEYIRKSLLVTAPDPDLEDRYTEQVSEKIKGIIESYFQSFHNRQQYILPITLVLMFSGLIVTFLALWAHSTLLELSTPFKTMPTPLLMALAGGFFWSLWEVFNRADSNNLTPAQLYEVSFRLASALPIGYVFSLLAFDTVPSLVAFLAAAFPVRELRRILKLQTLRKIDTEYARQSQPVQTEDIRSRIRSISRENQVLLEEMSIYTPGDLAYSDPLEIMVCTGLLPTSIIEWIDQALWFLYVGSKKDKLKMHAVGTAIEACHFYEDNCLEEDETGKFCKKDLGEIAKDPVMKEIAKILEIPVPSLVRVLEEVRDDPYVINIVRLWGDTTMTSTEDK